MSGDLIIIALVIAVAMLVVLIAKLASFLKAFTEDTRYICCEMERADSYAEYRQWRGELRCHYLCLIPFVNEKNVMSVYRFFFHKGDHAKKKERKDSIIPLLMPSILGICICLVCVCGMTWAWYTASVQTPTQKMTAAYYEVSVESVMSEADKVDPLPNGGYELKAETTYTVKLNANGSVKDCGGYCLIKCGETELYTQTFKPEQTITITLPITETGTYTFTGVWGSHPVGTDDEKIINAKTKDEENNSNPPSDNQNTLPVTDESTTDPVDPTEPTELSGTYTVQAGDTLSAIAARYSTSVKKLQAYNDISDPSHITVGQKIAIPPQDYVVPEPPAPSEPTTTEPIQTETAPPVSELVSEPVTDAPTITEPTDTTSVPADTDEQGEQETA